MLLVLDGMPGVGLGTPPARTCSHFKDGYRLSPR